VFIPDDEDTPPRNLIQAALLLGVTDDPIRDLSRSSGPDKLREPKGGVDERATALDLDRELHGIPVEHGPAPRAGHGRLKEVPEEAAVCRGFDARRDTGDSRQHEYS
jgi:hypothetical protein